MTTEKKTFFHFHDQNTELDHRIQINCTEEEWEEFYEDEVAGYEPFMEELEEIAVHDASGSYDEDCNFLGGFTSPEVDNQEKLDKILAIWKKELIRKGWVKEEDQFFSVKEPV